MRCPGADWPADKLERAKARGAYLGFKPPPEAAAVLAGADALLVVMSFEESYRRFMETSFTTKFLDYAAFAKPVILWGPEYCTPVKVAQREGGALVVTTPEPVAIVESCRRIATDGPLRQKLSIGAARLRDTVFNPDRLQSIFVREITRLADRQTPANRGSGSRASTLGT